MNKSTHPAWQWNPPKRQTHSSESFDASRSVLSATECTGLVQHPPENEQEAHDLSALFRIHPVKPQGNIGKCNPNNSPDEIRFHRS